MTAWQPSEPPQEWVASPPQQPWPPPAAPVMTGAAEPRPASPLPPATVCVSAGAALATTILLVVALVTGGVSDVLTAAGLRGWDAPVLGGLLGTGAIAGFLVGPVALLMGRGTGLQRLAGAIFALLSLAAVATAAVVQGLDMATAILGLVLALGAAVTAGCAATPSAARWVVAAERRSAERAIARLTGPREAPLPGRGRVSLAVSVVAVLSTVLAGVLVAGSLAPDVLGAAPTPDGAVSVADPVPVDVDDFEYSPDLDQLARSCADGVLASCDDLWLEADLHSDYARYGSTCGGRTEVEYAGTCDDLFD